MDAKEFELPIEGSLGKLAILHIQQTEEYLKITPSDKDSKKKKKSKAKKK